ncbi:MAG TPA: hydroxypyruvate isomerase family protein [Rhodocyclaceae bacterium]|nr:hydroxypyruvate isomerase family protein [Rhodocyclaceae bacterium]
MPKFCANLSFLFTELPFAERFAAAARAGFSGVEYLSPYEFPAQDVAGWLSAHDLQQVLFNLPAGDWGAGERGLACVPGREADFRRGVEQALDYARALGCRIVHCMAGIAPPSETAGLTRRRYLDNLRYCADQCAALGVTVTIEPINTRIDMPGYWLNDVGLALGLLDEIERPNVRLQLDLYHAHVIGAPLADLLDQHIDRIAHIQVADYPGRHEPGSGEIPFAALFARLDRLGYQGWVGCEYRPRQGTEAGLGWLSSTFNRG